MGYTVDYFIQKFEAIPENRWIIGEYGNGSVGCAFGHCGMRNHPHIGYNEEAGALYRLFIRNGCASPDDVNDGRDPNYQKETPKQRIIAALRDIKEKLSKEQEVQGCDASKADSSTDAWPNITSELAKLPVEETSDVTPIPVNTIKNSLV